MPHGAALGPLLFLLYVRNREPACVDSLFLYADDSVVFVLHKDKDKLQKILSVSELSKIWNW